MTLGSFYRSYSTETLNLFPPSTDGFIPMSLTRGGTMSQPRTPVSGVSNYYSGASGGAGSVSSFPTGRSLSLGSRSVGEGATPKGVGVNVGGGGSASVGKTMREYDENLRDLKKENFNLKLRIYFLEERLGASHRGSAVSTPTGVGASNDIQQSNMDLKIQVESLKYDVQEKTDLLKEAGLALEQLENKISRLTVEREEERTRLESRLQQMEEDLTESQIKLFDDEDEPLRRPSQPPPQIVCDDPFSPSSSGADSSKDEDERLLREVEAEMARPVPFNLGSGMKPGNPLFLPLSGSSETLMQQQQQTSTPMRPTQLAVVEERAAEAEVEELNQALRLSEECLEEAQKEVQQRLKDMIALESELVNRDIQITSLKDELSQARSEISTSSASHKEELELLSRERDAATQRLQNVEEEVAEHREKVNEQMAENKDLSDQVSILNTQLSDLHAVLFEKDAALAKLQNETAFAMTPRCPDSTDPSNFSIHTHQLLTVPGKVTSSGERLQVVTQHLHIPPSGHTMPTYAEVDRLKRDIKKLRDYLKTSVQERKLLLRKIGTLNDKLAKVDGNGAIACSVCKEENSELSGAPEGLAPRHLLLRIANLQQRLANTSEDADLLRSQLESVVESLEPLAKKNLVCSALVMSTKKVVEQSRATSKSVSRAPTPLVLEVLHKEGDIADAEQDRQRNRLSVGSMGSLPDPSLLDFGELNKSYESAVKTKPANLYDEDQVSIELERKTALLDLMEDKLAEKDGLIREQASLLEEYKVEMLKIKGELSNDHGHSSLDRRMRQRKFKGLSTPQSRRRATSSTTTLVTANEMREAAGAMASVATGAVSAITRNTALHSDGDDSWSEPDVNAARRRMGLSTAHLLAAQKKVQDSSETEAEKKHKSFYALEYTGHNFSEDEDNEEAYLDSLAFDDYSKIIQELQSHRKEIEKLQSDFSQASRSGQSHPLREEDEQTEDNQAVPTCSPATPGALECLVPGIGDLLRAMDELSYQLDVSDSFDSGNGSDEEEQETEAETSQVENIDMAVCTVCANVVCKDIEHCLNRCSQLILASSGSIRRLRRICYNLRSRFSKTNDDLASQNHVVQQLEQTVVHLTARTEQMDRLETELDKTKDELARRSRDLQETQIKMNDNYKLVAELSNENLKLAGDKVRAEELVEDLKKDQSALRNELTSAQRVLEQINYNRNGGGSGGSSRVWHNSKFNRGSESSGFADAGSVSAAESAHHGAYPVHQQHYQHDHYHHQQQQHHRGHRNYRRGGKRHNRHQGHHQQQVDNDARRPQSSIDPGEYHAETLPTSGSIPVSLVVPTTVATAASDISSPDLGVDVSSDPFSSLERTNNNPSMQRVMIGSTVKPSSLDAVVLENRQLRQDRDALMEKLIRSKGALKETLDRLTTSKEYKRDSGMHQPSPLPPKKVLSSTAVLSSVGSESSRAKVTQELIEFSKTHNTSGGGGGQHAHSGGGGGGGGGGHSRRAGSRARKEKGSSSRHHH